MKFYNSTFFCDRPEHSQPKPILHKGAAGHVLDLDCGNGSRITFFLGSESDIIRFKNATIEAYNLYLREKGKSEND